MLDQLIDTQLVSCKFSSSYIELEFEKLVDGVSTVWKISTDAYVSCKDESFERTNLSSVIVPIFMEHVQNIEVISASKMVVSFCDGGRLLIWDDEYFPDFITVLNTNTGETCYPTLDFSNNC